jgi:hypothetical protein
MYGALGSHKYSILPCPSTYEWADDIMLYSIRAVKDIASTEFVLKTYSDYYIFLSLTCVAQEPI